MKAVLETACVQLASGFVVLISVAVILERRKKPGGIGAGGWLAMALLAGPALVAFVVTLLGFK